MIEEELPVIALIPVKSESTRFPGKNFSSFNETSLLENTVSKLIKSKSVDKIVISTDSPEKVLKFVGGVSIIERSKELCKPDSTTDEVVFDLIKSANLEDYIIIVCQVTSPNWSPHYISYAINKLKQTKVDTVISVSPDLKPNGCFYIFRASTFVKNRKIYTPNMYLVTMGWDESADIDYQYQSFLAQSIAKGNFDNSR